MKLIDADSYKEILYGMMPKFDEDNDKKCIEGQTIYFCIAALDDMPEITPPPNAPLTSDELREMDGEPVWDSVLAQYGYVDSGCNYIRYINDWWNPRVMVNNRFYRRKPEEGTT